MKVGINKKSMVAIVAMIAVGSAQANLVDNLVGYYDFETDLSNKAGAAYDGSITTGGASGTGTWRTGATDATGPGFSGISNYYYSDPDPDPENPNKTDGVSNRGTLLVGNAINFLDADNTFATIPLGTAQLGQEFSISAWTYLAPGTGNGSPRFHAFEASNNWDVSWGTVSGDTSMMRTYVGQLLLTPDVAVTHEQWQHVAQVYTTEGSDTRLDVYVDGVLAITGTQATSSMNFSGLNFGDYRNGTSDRDWDGMIDEVAIWDRAVTSTEVTELYNLGLNGQAIPEPATLGMVAAFGGAMLFLRRRRAF